MSSFIHFRWDRTREFSWVEAPVAGRQQKQWWLVPDSESSGSQYQPLKDELALFRTFCDTEPTLEGIKAFAFDYGDLGVGEAVKVEEDTVVIGESFNLWAQEITEMKAAVDIWDAREDEQWLEDRIQVDRKGDSPTRVEVLIESYPDGSPAVTEWMSEKQHREIWPHIKGSPHGSVVGQAAMFHVQGAINSRAERYAAPRLLYNPENGQMELRLDPGNLLGAMWLQFARALEGDKTYRRCEVCRAWFEVSADGKRRQTKYCSTRCRMRAYRDRKEVAQRRAAAGEPISEIALGLGTTKERVQGWIESARSETPSQAIRDKKKGS